MMSIPASYREVPGSNTGQEAGSAGLMFRIFPRSLTKKFLGGGGGGGGSGGGGGGGGSSSDGGDGGGCGDMMMIVVVVLIIIIIIITHLSPALKRGR